MGHFKFHLFDFDYELEEEEITKNPRLNRHKDAIRDISFSPNDNKFITCSIDKTLKIWDTYEVKFESVLEGHGSDVLTCDWHPWMNLVASGSKDRILKIWSPNQKQANICNIYHHTNSINTLKYISIN